VGGHIPAYRHSRVVLVAASALALTAASAGPGSAATLATLPCTVDFGSIKTVPIVGKGFAPNTTVEVSATDTTFGNPSFLASPETDASGHFSTTVFPPLFKAFDTNVQDFGMTATDFGTPPITAQTKFRQVRFGFTTFPSRARPTDKVKYTVRGFLPGTNVYAHFRFAGKTVKDIKLGKATAPCGQVSRRMRLIPATPHAGTWGVYMDQVPSFSKTTNPQAKGRLTVSLSFR